MDETKAVIIISDEYDELGSAINKRLGRNSTNLKASGDYSGNDKDVIAAQEALGSQFKSPIH